MTWLVAYVPSVEPVPATCCVTSGLLPSLFTNIYRVMCTMQIIGRQKCGVGLKDYLCSSDFITRFYTRLTEMESNNSSRSTLELESTGEEYTKAQPLSAAEFLQQGSGNKLRKLSRLSNDLDVPLQELISAIAHSNAEDRDYRVYSLIPSCDIKVEIWEHSGRLKTDHATFEGFLHINITNLIRLSNVDSVDIQLLWESDLERITSAAPVQVLQSNLFIETEDVPLLVEDLTRTDKPLLVPELVKLINDKHEGDAYKFLLRHSELDEKNQKLKSRLEWFAAGNTKEKKTATNLLVAGLIAELVNLDRDRFIKPSGRLNIQAIESAVIAHLDLGPNLEKSTNFRNLIPSLYNQFAKK